MKNIITNHEFIKILDEQNNYFITLSRRLYIQNKPTIIMFMCRTIYTGYFEIKMHYYYYDSGNDEVFYTDKII